MKFYHLNLHQLKNKPEKLIGFVRKPPQCQTHTLQIGLSRSCHGNLACFYTAVQETADNNKQSNAGKYN